jgi:hypothetical protein
MVCREAVDKARPPGRGAPIARCTPPTGESPVPVSIGAPGSRSQARGGDSSAQAGRQEPVKRRKPRSGEQARGPQHKVKPAASTEKQSGGRADHVAAKATPTARAPKRVVGPGGVRGAARVQGGVRNTGDPSAQPQSRQDGSNKPMAKSSVAQRESEGLVVPMMAATNNAVEGKGLCFGRARSEGKREGMAGTTGPNHPDACTCVVQVRQPQYELCGGAKWQVASQRRMHNIAWGDARASMRCRDASLAVQAPPRRPSVSRVREIRKHGLKGGLALLPVTKH